MRTGPGRRHAHPSRAASPLTRAARTSLPNGRNRCRTGSREEVTADSEGTPSGFGWGLSQDVEGALDYLAARDDVDRSRIGGLGISTGADVLLEVAADRRELAAVVTDGAAAMTWQDARRIDSPALESAAGWVTFQAIGVLTGADRPRVIEDRVAAMRAPLLLISAGRSVEHDFNVLYERAAGGPVDHWNLPDVDHSRGLRDRPREYERRVTAFLDTTLQVAEPG